MATMGTSWRKPSKVSGTEGSTQSAICRVSQHAWMKSQAEGYSFTGVLMIMTATLSPVGRFCHLTDGDWWVWNLRAFAFAFLGNLESFRG